MRDDDSSIASAAGLRLGIASSRYHRAITEALRDGARRAFVEAGGRDEDVVEVAAPGAFELPILAAALAAREDVDVIVALGCVVRGETSHDRHINDAVAAGLQRVALDSGKPVAFGVLTTSTIEQARARAGGAVGNKGEEATRAAIATRRALEETRRLGLRA